MNIESILNSAYLRLLELYRSPGSTIVNEIETYRAHTNMSTNEFTKNIVEMALNDSKQSKLISCDNTEERSLVALTLIDRLRIIREIEEAKERGKASTKPMVTISRIEVEVMYRRAINRFYTKAETYKHLDDFLDIQQEGLNDVSKYDIALAIYHKVKEISRADKYFQNTQPATVREFIKEWYECYESEYLRCYKAEREQQSKRALSGDNTMLTPQLPKELDSVTAKRGRPKKVLRDVLLCEEDKKDDVIDLLHTLIDGRIGKDVSLIVVAAKKAGIVTKITYAQAQVEFGEIGNSSGYNKYIREEKTAFADIEIDPIVERIKTIAGL